MRAAHFLSAALRPPSRLPLGEWSERHVRLDHTSYIQGPVSLEFYPQLRSFLRHADRRRVRRMVAMTSAQSAKTTAAMLTLLHRIAENPTPTIWVSANAEKAKEFTQRRLAPAIMDCQAAARFAPPDSEWTRRLVRFATMDLMIRGAVSKQDMTSDPAGLVICDERREWSIPIELVRQRLKTFGNAQEISIGTAGLVNDSLHTDWEQGSQGFIHFACPHCQHPQPFRFGKKKSALFPEPRDMGGVVWPDDERTRNEDGTWKLEPTVKPDGSFENDGVRRLASYQCEKCGGLIQSGQRLSLLKTAFDFHRSPKMLEQFPSLHWNFMVMPGESMDFGAGAVTFLAANEILKKTGNTDALRSFICDDCGEPWEMMASKVEASDIMARIGNYQFGEPWADASGELFNVLTVDRQKDSLVYVWRQWLKGGASRMVMFGKLPDDFEALRKFQIDHKIRNVAGDDGGYEDGADSRNVYRWREACLKYGWTSFKGDKADNFRDDKVRRYWRHSPFSTGVGHHILHQSYLFSKAHYLGKLFNVFLKGEGPSWSLPRNAPGEYLAQMQAYEYIPPPQDEWVKKGADHASSCEMMQIVFADSAGIIQQFS